MFKSYLIDESNIEYLPQSWISDFGSISGTIKFNTGNLENSYTNPYYFMFHDLGLYLYQLPIEANPRRIQCHYTISPKPVPLSFRLYSL